MKIRIATAIIVVIVGVGLGLAVILQARPLFALDTATPRVILENQSSPNDVEVTSGGALVVVNGIASTLTGQAEAGEPWYKPDQTDLDKRLYPQIVFRMLAPQHSIAWADYEIVTEIVPIRDLPRVSSAGDGTDGIHLLLHDKDPNNLYTAGITKDGRLSIKRKIQFPDGTIAYASLAEARIFEGEYSPGGNLITPFEEAKIVMRSSIRDIAFDSVAITLTVEVYNLDGSLAISRQLTGVDDGQLLSQGTRLPMGPPILFGRPGLRLDAMEAKILSFVVNSL